MTENLPFQEIGGSLIDNKNAGGPSTKISVLNQRRDNDIRGTDPTPRKYVDNIQSTTFPGLNLLLTPQTENSGIYKTQTESPLDNKTTRKKTGTLSLLQNERNQRKHQNITGRHNTEALNNRFLQRRGVVWQIKGDHSNTQIETSSSLTPTGAVVMEKDRRFKMRPFPGRNARYYEKSSNRHPRYRHDEYRYAVKRKNEYEREEGGKHEKSLELGSHMGPNHVLSENKKTFSLFHTTTPKMDQLQVIRMMANVIYKTQYRQRGKPQSNKSFQHLSNNAFENSENKSSRVLAKYSSQEKTQSVKVKNDIKKLVKSKPGHGRYRIKDKLSDLTTTFGPTNSKSDEKKDETKVTSDKNQQENNEIRDAFHFTENKTDQEISMEDQFEIRNKQTSHSRNGFNTAETITDDEGNIDKITPPTLFEKKQQKQDLEYLNTFDVDQHKDDDFDILFENILSSIKISTARKNIRQVEATTSSIAITQQPETAPILLFRSATATGSTSTTMTKGTKTAIKAKVAKYGNSDQLNRKINRNNHSVEIKSEENKDHTDNEKTQIKDRDAFEKMDNRGLNYKKIRTYIDHRPFGQNSRHYLNEPDLDSYLNNDINRNTPNSGYSPDDAIYSPNSKMEANHKIGWQT